VGYVSSQIRAYKNGRTNQDANSGHEEDRSRYDATRFFEVSGIRFTNQWLTVKCLAPNTRSKYPPYTADALRTVAVFLFRERMVKGIGSSHTPDSSRVISTIVHKVLYAGVTTTKILRAVWPMRPALLPHQASPGF
jgi:hypothetical protein